MIRQPIWLIALGFTATITLASATFTIPSDQIDRTQIFFGTPASFDTPAEVHIDSVIAATPEYKEIQSEKLKKGTGKYWILVSKATDRAIEAVSNLGTDTNYDLITERGYLGSLNPPIACDDVTRAQNHGFRLVSIQAKQVI